MQTQFALFTECTDDAITTASTFQATDAVATIEITQVAVIAPFVLPGHPSLAIAVVPAGVRLP